MSLPNKKKQKKASLFQALCLAGAPLHFFCRRTTVTTHVFFVLFFVFSFFFRCCFWGGERRRCHIINSKLCFCTRLSVTRIQWKKTARSVSHIKKKKRARSLLFLNYRAQFQDGYLFRNTTGPGRRETAVPVWSHALQTFFFLFFDFTVYPLPCKT